MFAYSWTALQAAKITYSKNKRYKISLISPISRALQKELKISKKFNTYSSSSLNFVGPAIANEGRVIELFIAC